MNKEGNSYTFLFATLMVITVAALLSVAALYLQPLQEQNMRIEKMQNILAAAGIESTVDNAEKVYNEKIKESFTLNAKGQKVDNQDAFSIKLTEQFDKEPAERLLPLYKAQLEGGKKVAIVPVRGKGLWGPIWGYVAFEGDYNTLAGAYFDHKGETPGLGAEISEKWFQEQFIGKKIFDDGKFVSIDVVKGTAGDNPHKVDGVSGGTITSDGLEEMLRNSLLFYIDYFNTKRK
jgi:Na+-transporting NADH:ubiquinone oxidoreductase subunit C